MNEQDLVRKIKELKKIQPCQEWMDSTRHNLLARVDFDQEADSKTGIGLFYWLRQTQSAVLVTCLLIIFLLGPWLTIKASQPSLPGDLLYSIKKISENVQTSVASENTKTQLQVEFASRRLEELAKIAEDPFAPEQERSQQAKAVVDQLKNNLAGASNYVDKISKEKVIAIAKKAQKIKEDLDGTKREAPLEEIKSDLAEAEKAIDEINQQILAVLIEDSQEDIQGAATSTDEEILIFLEELEDGIITSTEEFID